MQLFRQGRVRVVWMVVLGVLLASGTVMITVAQDNSGGDMLYACIDSRNGALYGAQIDSENVRCSRGDDQIGWALGEPGPGGSTGISFAGSWQSGITYMEGVIVEHEGSSYVAITEADVEPPHDAYWQVIALRGADGEDGERGPQGEPGAPGQDGEDGEDGQDGQDGQDGDQGERGLTGIQGPAGRDGDGFAWRGDFDASETYELNDVVHHDGSAWVAVAESTSSEPGSDDDWELFVQGFDSTDDNGNDNGSNGNGTGGAAIYRVSEVRSGAELNALNGTMEVTCPSEAPRVLSGGFQIVNSDQTPFNPGSSAFDLFRGSGPVMDPDGEDAWRVSWSFVQSNFAGDYLRVDVTCTTEVVDVE